MATGRIPLLDAEDLSMVASFQKADFTCLPIFLCPPSIDWYQQRLHKWLSETERALVRYEVAARCITQQAIEAGFYDDGLVNSKLNGAIKDAVDLAKRHRPDLFRDVSTGEDDLFAKEPWRAVRIVVLAQNVLWSHLHDAAFQKLLDLLPDKFAALPETTTRKPTKGEADTGQLIYGAKAQDLQQLKDQGHVLTWREERGDIYCRTLAAAEQMYHRTGKLAVVALADDQALEIVREGLPSHILMIQVRFLVSNVGVITSFVLCLQLSDCKHSCKCRLMTSGSMQLTPGLTARECTTSAADELEANAVDTAMATSEDLTLLLVPNVIVDNTARAVACLRNILAERLPHHLTAAPDALVIAGPFGIGKRRLMQRMLALYPQAFEMPRVYTTNAASSGGGRLTVVEPKFLDNLRAMNLLALEEHAIDESYAISLEDVDECVLQCGLT
jgi:guanylate kinase